MKIKDPAGAAEGSDEGDSDVSEEMEQEHVVDILDQQPQQELIIPVADEMEEDSSSNDSDSEYSEEYSDSDEDAVEEAENEEDEDDDPVIKSIRSAKEKKKSDHPPDLDLSPNSPSCMSFHATEDILAVATFDGDLRLYGYSNEENALKQSVTLSEGNICREISYSADGNKLFLAAGVGRSSDIYIYDVRDGLRLERKLENAAKAAVSSLYVIDENVFATGDDDGHVMLWDQRSKDAYATMKVSEDCISSMITNQEKRILVCTSTDGSLFAIRIRGGSVQTESEVYNTEFNCIGLFKQESKIAVGNGEGSIHVFNWNEFGRHADIYTGIGKKNEPINSLIPLTERIILSGGEDGCIRAMHFYPQKYLGLVGKVPYSIEKMDVCNDGHLIAAFGPDEEIVKFWNVSYFENMSISTEEKMKKNTAKPPQDDSSKSNLPSSSLQNAKDFYQGLL